MKAKTVVGWLAGLTLMATPALAGQAPGQNGLLAFWYSPPTSSTSFLAVGDPSSDYFEVILDVAASPVVDYVGHSSWSPDGSRIAFSASNDTLSDWRMYVINVDGSGLQELFWDDDGTPEPLQDCFNFEWAENGLIYAACYDSPGGSIPNGTIVFNPDTGEVAHFCPEVLHQHMALSPNRQTIVSVEQGVAIQTAPASDPCNVSSLSTTPGDINPQHTIWAPDGNSLFFTDRPAFNRRDIYTVGASGGNLTLVIEDGFSPSPSPDGQFLAYVDWNSRQVTVSGIDGSDPVNLFTQWGVDGEAGSVSWSREPVPQTAPVSVPTQSPAGLAMLMMLLAGLGLLAVRKMA